MKKTVSTLLLIIFAIFLLACEADYRKNAVGPMSEVLIVMDSTAWESETANALRDLYGGVIFTLPVAEERYDLRFMSLRTQRDLDRAKSHKNVIFASPINEQNNVAGFINSIMSDDVLSRVREGQNFMFPLGDRWYRDQWVMLLTGRSDEELARKIRANRETLLNSLNTAEIPRWQAQVYRRGEQKAVADSLMENHGFSIRVQHDYRIGVDTTGFVSMRRYLHDNDRWIWFAYKEDWDDGLDNIDQEWINAVRDSLNRQFIRGTRDESYVTTEYRAPRAIETVRTQVNGRPALETRGTWRMTNDIMGGPFLHYTVFDEQQNRLYMMEFAQFAPRYSKRRFMNQFEAMAHTFETDTLQVPEPVALRK